MRKEQKDKILEILVDMKIAYTKDCEKRIAIEQGKVMGAEFMLCRIIDILSTETEHQECEETNV